MDKKTDLLRDQYRYGGKIPYRFQRYYRLCRAENRRVLKLIYKALLRHYRNKYLIELSYDCQIGGGLYIGHPSCITINPNAVIGANCNIHKGVTIGQENRGKRKGSPIIGNNVWIGVNSTIVGHILIGDDVLIAPNTYVNCDVPSHSLVFGNPCIIKHRDNATKGYINNVSDIR